MARPRKQQPPPPPQRRPANTGSVHWSESRQRWRARLPKRLGEKTARESWHFTQAAAESWIAREMERAADSFDPRRPLGEYLTYWRRLHAHRLAPQTRLVQESQAKAYSDLHATPLERLRGDQIQAAQARLIERGATRSYARTVTTLLKRALNDAVRWKILTENVADTVTLPEPEHRRARAWDVDETRAVLAEIVGHRFEAVYLLILWAGLRIGEAIAMRWDALDDDNVVTVETSEHTRVKGRPIGTTKRERVRQVDLPAFVAARLRELRASSSSVYVAGRPKGGRYSAPTIRRVWGQIVARVKITVLTPHGGRRSFGTMHMLAGTPLADIAVLMGHASPATTAAAYLGSSRTRRKEAAERLADLVETPKGSPKGQSEGQETS